MFVRKNLAIILIVSIAFLVRFAGVELLPPSLNWDEVSHGYNAYSILKTGKDEWGEFLPIIFRAYGDYKLPVYIYFVAISEFFLGISALAVRLPSILAGTVSVFFTYLLVDHLAKNKKIAILAALLLAVEPWGVFISRIGSEANFSVALILTGIYFLILGLEKKNWILLLSISLLGLSVWTYNSARVFVPLMLVALGLIYRKEVSEIIRTRRRLAISFLIVGIVFFIPMFYQLANPTGQARYEEVAILDQGAIAKINEARNNSPFTSPVPRLLHNKVTYFTPAFITNYFSHFSPNFLYFNGGSDFQFNIPDRGILYPLGLPFFVVGIAVAASQFREKKAAQLLLAWLLLAPVAASLTRESPHTLRSIMMLPIPMILTSYGVFWSWRRIRKYQYSFIVLGIFIFILGFSIEEFAQVYALDYRNNYSWSWQYGYKQAADYSRDHYSEYDKILISKRYGEPHEFILFWWPWEPAKYRDDPNLIRFSQSNWFWVDRFDKFYFINDWQVEDLVLESGSEVDCSDSKCLLITSPGNSPNGFEKIETIDFLDNSPAFDIYDN